MECTMFDVCAQQICGQEISCFFFFYPPAAECRPAVQEWLLSADSLKLKQMEIALETPISAIAVHPNQFDQICLGHLDGEISCCFFNKAADGGPEKRLQFEKKWKRWMKSAARALKFSDDGSALFVTSSNRAICMFDTETGKKLRCIQKGHASRPNALSVLTPTTSGEYNFATGAESGEIKLWDFRQSKPQIATFNEQEDTINAFDIWKSSLLAASDDGTLAAYDLRKQKLATQSEAMHSELLSLALTGSSTYAGAADGHIEVFNNGEYGNIRERIETPLLMGVEQLLKIRESNLLLAGSSTHEKMSFVHVRPNKCLGGIPYAEGIDLLEKTADSSTLLATSADGTKLMLWPLSDLINDVPELRSQEMRKFNEKQKEERKKLKRPANGDFFEDMFDQETDEEEEENGNADDQNEE